MEGRETPAGSTVDGARIANGLVLVILAGTTADLVPVLMGERSEPGYSARARPAGEHDICPTPSGNDTSAPRRSGDRGGLLLARPSRAQCGIGAVTIGTSIGSLPAIIAGIAAGYFVLAVAFIPLFARILGVGVREVGLWWAKPVGARAMLVPREHSGAGTPRAPCWCRILARMAAVGCTWCSLGWSIGPGDPNLLSGSLSGRRDNLPSAPKAPKQGRGLKRVQQSKRADLRGPLALCAGGWGDERCSTGLPLPGCGDVPPGLALRSFYFVWHSTSIVSGSGRSPGFCTGSTPFSLGGRLSDGDPRKRSVATAPDWHCDQRETLWIGENAIIFQNVTIGGRGDPPILGCGVQLGAGCCVLEGVVLGPECRVGANAVVTHSFPAGTTLVGIPARPLGPRPETFG